MSENGYEPTVAGWPLRDLLALVAIPLAVVAAVCLCRVDVAGLLATRESSATLLRAAEASDPAAPNPATAELVARLCDGRLVGEEARQVVAALWPPRVTPSFVATMGEEMSMNARLVVPVLDRQRDDGPTLAWRLVAVYVDDAPPITFDAPPTRSRLGAHVQETRWDPFRLPPTCRPGPVRLWCEYEYELRDAAGGTTRWRKNYDRSLKLIAAAPDGEARRPE